MDKYYCENCFKEGLKHYIVDELGSIFCDIKCLEESMEYREVSEHLTFEQV